MAQVIAPESWQEGIDDNRLLPNRYTLGLFTGNTGVKNIANNLEACRVWDIQISDYITDYDDRRLNGLGGNTEGRDGWGASAYGVFQDVRFDSRVYTMGRHRSCAMRVFEEAQYSGRIGQWGDAAASNVITNGEALMKKAALLSRAQKLWEQQVLGVDIDKYNLHAVMNGHITGRWVQDDPDSVCSSDGQWVAQPGMVQGQAIPPHFAPIHAIEWEDTNTALMLQTVKVTWNNLFIPQEDRVILIDPFYEYRVMSSLTGQGVPVTSEAYNDLKNGSFARLMGWDFDFTIPSQYWPQLYLDDNLNVVHSPDGTAAYDKVINSISGGNQADRKLQNQLVASDRMVRPNFVRTVWDSATGTFVKRVINYPLGIPGTDPYLGLSEAVEYDWYDSQNGPDGNQTYPWSYPGSGYGLHNPTGPRGEIVRRQVIGCFLYRKAAQLSQEYSNMLTEEGGTRGKFTEMVMEVKYDAFVIESLSHGIVPIVDSAENTGVFAIPVTVMAPDEDQAEVTGMTVVPDTLQIGVGAQEFPTVTVSGTGNFDKGFVALTNDNAIASVSPVGVVTGVSAGETEITYTAIGNPAITTVLPVTVTSK